MKSNNTKLVNKHKHIKVLINYLINTVLPGVCNWINDYHGNLAKLLNLANLLKFQNLRLTLIINQSPPVTVFLQLVTYGKCKTCPFPPVPRKKCN